MRHRRDRPAASTRPPRGVAATTPRRRRDRPAASTRPRHRYASTKASSDSFEFGVDQFFVIEGMGSGSQLTCNVYDANGNKLLGSTSYEDDTYAYGETGLWIYWDDYGSHYVEYITVEGATDDVPSAAPTPITWAPSGGETTTFLAASNGFSIIQGNASYDASFEDYTGLLRTRSEDTPTLLKGEQAYSDVSIKSKMLLAEKPYRDFGVAFRVQDWEAYDGSNWRAAARESIAGSPGRVDVAARSRRRRGVVASTSRRGRDDAAARSRRRRGVVASTFSL